MSADASRAREHALSVLDWAGVAEALAERCATAAGGRAARALRPDLKRRQVERWLDLTMEARELLREESVPVAGVRDLGDSLAAAGRGGALEPEELSDISRSLDAMGRLRGWLLERTHVAPDLAELGESLLEAPQLVAAIDRAIDPRGAVRDDASPELVRLLRQKAALATNIENRLQSLRRDPDVSSALSDDFFTVRDDRYVLPVRSDRRKQVAGILHGRSGSGQSLYIEPSAIVELNNDLRSAGMEIEEEIHRRCAPRCKPTRPWTSAWRARSSLGRSTPRGPS
jgi:DNA mismatch repair protein MutS2